MLVVLRTHVSGLVWPSVAIVFFVASTVCAFLAERVPMPGLRATPAVCDMGTVRQHEKIKKRVVVTNFSNLPLNIRKVLPTCACTLVSLPPGEIPPRG